MGDAGALILGLLMAAATMVIGGRTPPRRERPDLLLLRPPLHPGLHPRRAPRRHGLRLRPPDGQPAPGFHTPDKNHIHHRLMRLGHGHRRTRGHPVGLDGAALRLRPLPALRHQVNAFIPFGVVALGLGLYTLFHPSIAANGVPAAGGGCGGPRRRRPQPDRGNGAAVPPRRGGALRPGDDRPSRLRRAERVRDRHATGNGPDRCPRDGTGGPRPEPVADSS